MPQTVHRQCTLCEAHCGIDVEVEGDRVLRITGDARGPDLARLHLPEGGGARGPVRGSRPAAPAGAPRRLASGCRSAGTRRSTSPPTGCARVQRAPRRRRGRHVLRQPERAHDGGAVRAVAAPRARHAQPLLGDIGRPAAPAPDVGRDVREPRAVPDPRHRPHRLHARARREPVGVQRLADDGAGRAPPAARDRRARRHASWSWTRAAPRPRRTPPSTSRSRPGGDPYLLLGMLHVLFAEGRTRPRPPRRATPTGSPTIEALAARLAGRRAPRRSRASTRRRSQRLAREFAATPSARSPTGASASASSGPARSPTG